MDITCIFSPMEIQHRLKMKVYLYLRGVVEWHPDIIHADNLGLKDAKKCKFTLLPHVFVTSEFTISLLTLLALCVLMIPARTQHLGAYSSSGWKWKKARCLIEIL